MSADKERLQVAQWVLERNLAWIAAAEVKVGVIVAINTAMLGGLGAAFSTSDLNQRTAWAYLLAVAAAALLAAGLFSAAMTVLPRVTGPDRSLVFFGRIAALTNVDYIEQFKQVTDAQLLEDWSAQIHRNAQIARDKFTWVRLSLWWSFLSVLPWFAAIIFLLRK